MRRDAWWRGPIVLVFAVFAVAALFSVAKVWRAANPAVCDACRRPVHEGTRTAAMIDGRREVFCCPACALTAHRQSRNAIRVTELTDYTTDTPLAPSGAWVVTGSDVNLCAHTHAVIERDMHVATEAFDRCSPSILAFASRDAAGAFTREHGGRIQRFSELAAAYAK